MGFGHLRHLDLSGMLGQTSKPRCPPLFCPFSDNGQVEGCRVEQDESRRKQKSQTLPGIARRLGPGLAYHREVQLQGCSSLQRQGNNIRDPGTNPSKLSRFTILAVKLESL
jgi:hypothetical protein